MHRSPIASLAATVVIACSLAAQDEPAARATDLAPPVRLEAAGAVIDTPKIGHAAPFVGDFDGDGVQDLLVGQFDEGWLWIHRNEGTNGAPKLAAGRKFQDGRKEGTVPTG